MIKYWLLGWVLLIVTAVRAQRLNPGFDIPEYQEMLRVNAHIYGKDSSESSPIPAPESSKLIYRSLSMGLNNLYELWQKDANTAIFCTRGSVDGNPSWLANLYAAMVPATGKLEIDTNFVFDYKLSNDPNAAVHVGYLISTAYLSRDMLPQIDSLYKQGTRDILIIGHSQGGGISYLLTAYFYQLQDAGRLPKDIRFKTYCSAAPKPGNLYFAYEYENKSYGWAYQVVNPKDWVPQMPFTVQQMRDLPSRNPVTPIVSSIKKQGLKKRIAFRMLKNPSEKAVVNYQKILGKQVSKMVRVYLPNFKEPVYFPSNDYVRTGTHIILTPDQEYTQMFDESKSDEMMLHHSIRPYYELALKLRPTFH
ncbi:MAG: lipase family protein [Sphingobacterium sp.]|jgi:hypothetical protein|nr:lipase family protein [Sphingobacterium sp.]